MKEVHAQDIEELQNKIKIAMLDQREVETLKMVKDQALVANSQLRTSRLNYLSQVERLQNY